MTTNPALLENEFSIGDYAPLDKDFISRAHARYTRDTRARKQKTRTLASRHPWMRLLRKIMLVFCFGGKNTDFSEEACQEKAAQTQPSIDPARKTDKRKDERVLNDSSCSDIRRTLGSNWVESCLPFVSRLSRNRETSFVEPGLVKKLVLRLERMLKQSFSSQNRVSCDIDDFQGSGSDPYPSGQSVDKEVTCYIHGQEDSHEELSMEGPKLKIGGTMNEHAENWSRRRFFSPPPGRKGMAYVQPGLVKKLSTRIDRLFSPSHYVNNVKNHMSRRYKCRCR